MRKQLTIWAVAVAVLVSLWGVAIQTQGVQCGGSFVPSLNCTVSGRWLWTNITALGGSITQGPIPFQVRDQNNNPQDVTGIISRTTDLTNAQVLALNTTPITVVPAPGAGYFVDVIEVSLIFNYTGAYSTLTSDLRLYYSSRVAGNAASALIETTGFLDDTADAITRVTGVVNDTEPPTTNLPVVLQTNTGTAFAGGNASNTVRVVVNYRIVRTGL